MLPKIVSDRHKQFHLIIYKKLQCIICNISIDLHTKQHNCILRHEKDIIIINSTLNNLNGI
jgi:hypothetical protein